MSVQLGPLRNRAGASFPIGAEMRAGFKNTDERERVGDRLRGVDRPRKGRQRGRGFGSKIFGTNFPGGEV